MIYSVLAYLGEITSDIINHYYLLIDLVFIFYVIIRFGRNSMNIFCIVRILFVSCLVL